MEKLQIDQIIKPKKQTRQNRRVEQTERIERIEQTEPDITEQGEFCVEDLIFDQEINVDIELDLSYAIFSSRKINKYHIHKFCRTEKIVRSGKTTKNKYFKCFIARKIDQFGNEMTYYLGKKFLIVKCIKPTVPIPVIVTLELDMPMHLYFILKFQTEGVEHFDMLSFAQLYQENNDFLKNAEYNKLFMRLENIRSRSDYEDMKQVYFEQIEAVNTNRQITELLRDKGIDCTEIFVKIHRDQNELQTLSDELEESLERLTRDLDKTVKSLKLLISKF